MNICLGPTERDILKFVKRTEKKHIEFVRRVFDGRQMKRRI